MCTVVRPEHHPGGPGQAVVSHLSMLMLMVMVMMIGMRMVMMMMMMMVMPPTTFMPRGIPQQQKSNNSINQK